MKMNNHAIGLDVGATNIRIGIVDSSGNILWRSKAPTPIDDQNEFISVVSRLIDEARDVAVNT